MLSDSLSVFLLLLLLWPARVWFSCSCRCLYLSSLISVVGQTGLPTPPAMARAAAWDTTAASLPGGRGGDPECMYVCMYVCM